MSETGYDEAELRGSPWIFSVLIAAGFAAVAICLWSVYIALFEPFFGNALLAFVSGAVAYVLLDLARRSYYTVRSWERVVLLRWGKIRGVVGPGLRFKIPIIDKIIIRDMRTSALDIPNQEVITKDNISVTIDSVVFLRVMKPETNVRRIAEYRGAIAAYCNTTLRNVVGKMELDELLAQRMKVAEDISNIVDEVAGEWGVDIERVELTDIKLPGDMKRIMARQAEAEREKRGVIIKAEGEREAAKMLAQAAKTLREEPGALELRRLSTISDVSQDRSNTIIFAVPLEALSAAMPAAALAKYGKEEERKIRGGKK